MAFSNVTRRYSRIDSDDIPRSISRQQLFVLLVAAKKGLLEGNARGENIALGGWDGKSTMEPLIPKVWTSAMGQKLLDKITRETGIVFDRENYQLVEPRTHDEPAGIVVLGHFDTKREAALAHDRAVVIDLWGGRGDKLSARGKRTRCFPR
jgi:hypothetical protein